MLDQTGSDWQEKRFRSLSEAFSVKVCSFSESGFCGSVDVMGLGNDDGRLGWPVGIRIKQM